MERKILFVRRESGDITTVGVLTVTTHFSHGDTDATVLTRIHRALTKWAEVTPAGRDAWNISQHDFNIGDLGSYVMPISTNESVYRFLQIEGVRIDRVEINDGHNAFPFDLHLMNPNVEEN